MTTTTPMTQNESLGCAAAVLMAAEGVMAYRVTDNPDAVGVFSYRTTPGTFGHAEWEIYSTATGLTCRVPSGQFFVPADQLADFEAAINAANDSAWADAKAGRPANPPATPSYANTVYAWAYAKAHYLANGIECFRCREGLTMQWQADTGIYRCDTCGRTYRPRVPHYQRRGR